MNLYLYTQSPSGERVLCQVMEIITSLQSLLPMVGVRALHGRPFNGQKIAIVPMNGVFAVKPS